MSTSICEHIFPHPQPHQCGEPATWTVNGAPRCGWCASATPPSDPPPVIERIHPAPALGAAPGPGEVLAGRPSSAERALEQLTGVASPARSRRGCHFCGLPLRRGECTECV